MKRIPVHQGVMPGDGDSQPGAEPVEKGHGVKVAPIGTTERLSKLLGAS